MANKRSIVISKRITQRSTLSFNSYLTEIRNYNLLTDMEEEVYGQLAFEGDKEARDLLVTSNLRFVVSVAKQFTNNIEELQDLINEGNIGLQVAASRYNPDKGFKFLTFAVWWVRHKMNEYLYSDGRLIKLPLNKINEANEITNIKNSLSHKLQREPSTDEILEELFANNTNIKYDDDKLDRILAISENNAQSLDKLVSEDSGATTLIDMLEAPAITNTDVWLNKKDNDVIIGDMLKHLSDQQCTILKMCYGIGYNNDMTLKSIGEEIGMSRERVRQIKEQSIEKLKNLTKDKSHLLN